MTDAKTPVIVIAFRPPSFADEVRKVAPDADIRVVEEGDLAEAAEDADIIASVRLPGEAVRRARRLAWVQSLAAGPNEIFSDELRASPVPVTCCRGNGAAPLAEHAMMLMMMLDKDARRMAEAQANCHWDKFRHEELAGRTCGIIGTGRCGTDLALKAKAFHMNVLGLRRLAKPADHFDETFTADGMETFLGRSDFVVVTAALTEENRGMLGEVEFAMMKPSAFYVCVSRGAIADTDALLGALREGRIAGAGLDAHADEPLPSESPFWSMPNVIVTPHIGATSHGSLRRGNEIFLENLRRYLDGEPFINPVDKAAGY